MPREITHADGIARSCIQAFASLGNDPAQTQAAGVDGILSRLHVFYTLSGAARSVRVELPEGWEDDCSDQEIEPAIRLASD